MADVVDDLGAELTRQQLMRRHRRVMDDLVVVADLRRRVVLGTLRAASSGPPDRLLGGIEVRSGLVR